MSKRHACHTEQVDFLVDKDVRRCGKLDFGTWNLFQLLGVGKSWSTYCHNRFWASSNECAGKTFWVPRSKYEDVFPLVPKHMQKNSGFRPGTIVSRQTSNTSAVWSTRWRSFQLTKSPMVCNTSSRTHQRRTTTPWSNCLRTSTQHTCQIHRQGDASNTICVRRISRRKRNIHEATINDTDRTNNMCESWNHAFNHLVGRRHQIAPWLPPSCWALHPPSLIVPYCTGLINQMWTSDCVWTLVM